MPIDLRAKGVILPALFANEEEKMVKIHTRAKRKYGLSTRYRHYNYFHRIKKKNRPKTFKTEESAHAWASRHNLKPEQYYLRKTKRNKKFQVVMYDRKDKNIADKGSKT